MTTIAHAVFGLNKRAISMVSQGNLSEAIELLQRATRLYPEFLASHQNLGAVYMMGRELGAAAKCFLHVVSCDPKSVKAHFNLANIYRELGRTDDAIKHLQTVITLDPNHHSAEHILSACTGKNSERAPSAFVRELFDQYSNSFDLTLVRDLKYETPTSLATMLAKDLGAAHRFENVLDLGCGTGLAGVAIARSCSKLIGVDISSGMLDRAKEKGVYQTLVNDDILHFLKATTMTFDLFIASDVFNYFGNLQPVFDGISRCCQPSAHVIFSVENITGESFALAPTGRFRHSEEYVSGIAGEAGFKILSHHQETLRHEPSGPVSGTLFLMQLQDES